MPAVNPSSFTLEEKNLVKLLQYLPVLSKLGQGKTPRASVTCSPATSSPTSKSWLRRICDGDLEQTAGGVVCKEGFPGCPSLPSLAQRPPSSCGWDHVARWQLLQLHHKANHSSKHLSCALHAARLLCSWVKSYALDCLGSRYRNYIC